MFEIRPYYDIKPYYEMNTRELVNLSEVRFKEGSIDRSVKGIVFIEDERNITFLDLYSNTVQHFNSRKYDIIDKIRSLKCEYHDLGFVIKPLFGEEFEYLEREYERRWKARTLN